MTILNVRHTTVYRYRRPVRLGDHRLMLRPRDSHDLRLIRTSLNFSPAASVRWVHDVFGNSIAIALFTESAAELRIESRLQLETYVVERPRSLRMRRPIPSSIRPTIASTSVACSSATTPIRPVA